MTLLRTLTQASDGTYRRSIVQAVEQAIEHDVHPRRNAKGSSGSYLARDEAGDIVGCVHASCLSSPSSVFKPKDEEPYGRLNPKARRRTTCSC